jgi:predicted transcriptional regulator
MTVQLAIRVDDDVARSLDSLVPDRFPNRTEAIRTALEEFLDRQRRIEIGRRIVAGYERIPAGEVSDVAAYSAKRTAEQLDDWDWSDDDTQTG